LRTYLLSRRGKVRNHDKPSTSHSANRTDSARQRSNNDSDNLAIRIRVHDHLKQMGFEMATVNADASQYGFEKCGSAKTYDRIVQLSVSYLAGETS